jgi:hypothetical protein
VLTTSNYFILVDIYFIVGIENKGIPLPTTSGLTFIQPEISVVKVWIDPGQ